MKAAREGVLAIVPDPKARALLWSAIDRFRGARCPIAEKQARIDIEAMLLGTVFEAPRKAGVSSRAEGAASDVGEGERAEVVAVEAADAPKRP
jgi:hypothetical protein